MASNAFPSISVIMSVYNSEKYLKEAIASILTQTFTDFEFIIINDASTDGSLNILKSYTDPRIILVDNETNIGLTSSLNKGLTLAKGKYIARMDADDISHSNRFEIQFQYLEKNTDIGICGSWIELFDTKGQKSIIQFPKKHEEIFASLFITSGFAHPSVMLRNGIPELKYDETFVVSQDCDLWYRLLKHTKGANIPIALLKYRVSGENIGSLQSAKQHNYADLVRIKILNDIEAQLSEKEKQALVNLVHESWPAEEDSFKKTIHWFTTIINSNKEKQYFSESHFSEKIAKLCFYKCTCTKKIAFYKIYKQSDLFKYYNPSLKLKFNLYIKSILNSLK